MKALIMQSSQPPATSSFLGLNILLSILFSNTLSLSFLTVHAHMKFHYWEAGIMRQGYMWMQMTWEKN